MARIKPEEHTPELIARRIMERKKLRTGQRSRLRGRTRHVRPKVSDRFSFPPLYENWARGAYERAMRDASLYERTLRNIRQMARGGPVAGCTPEHCWHKYPHIGGG